MTHMAEGDGRGGHLVCIIMTHCGHIVFSLIFRKRYSEYSPNTRSYFAYLRNQTPFYVNYISKKKFMVKNLLCSKCDIWSLQNQHSGKQQNLSYLNHKEKNTSLVLLKTSIAIFFLSKRCCSQTVIFDLSKSSIPENNRIWVIWTIKGKVLHWCSWK